MTSVQQFSLFGQPVTRGDIQFPAPAARHTDPATSHAAAQRIKVSAASDRMLALRTLEQVDNLNDFELARLTSREQTSIGVRRGELVKAGGSSMSTCWRITAAGRAYLKEHA